MGEWTKLTQARLFYKAKLYLFRHTPAYLFTSIVKYLLAFRYLPSLNYEICAI